jgi:threonine/homoserine/homoserine lactone efflux protein
VLLLTIAPGPDFAVLMLTRRGVRRSLDGLTGAALVGFAGKLATEAS